MSTPAPYNSAKAVIIFVQCEKNYAILMHACPVVCSVPLQALTISCSDKLLLR